jgi:tetratricopeptide (TPR) repeat protein
MGSGIEPHFVLPVKDHLTVLSCSLCTKMVSLDGYVTIPCHHTFCQDCFTKWIATVHAKSKTCDCPNCGVSILANSSKSTAQKDLNLSNVLVRPLEVAQPLIHRMLSQVKVVCPCRNNTSFCSWTGDYASLEQHLSSFHKPNLAQHSNPEESRGRATERATEEKGSSSMSRPLRANAHAGQDTTQQLKSMSDLKRISSSHRRLPSSERSDFDRNKSSHRRREASDDEGERLKSSHQSSKTGSSSRSQGRSNSSDDGPRMNKSHRSTRMCRSLDREGDSSDDDGEGRGTRSGRSRKKSSSKSPHRSGSRARSTRTPMTSGESLKSSDALDLQYQLLEELKRTAPKSSSGKRSTSKQTMAPDLKRKVSKDVSVNSTNSGDHKKKLVLEELKRNTAEGTYQKRTDKKQQVLHELKSNTAKGAYQKRTDEKQKVLHEMKRNFSKDPSASSSSESSKHFSRGTHIERGSSSRRGGGRSSSRSPCRTEDKKSSLKHGSNSSKDADKLEEKRNAPAQPPSAKKSELSTFSLVIKDKANCAFKDGKYQDAVDLYTEAIDKYIYATSRTAADKELVATLYGNRAAGYLKQGLFLSCLNDCDSALALNSHLPRACLRKAWALKEMGEFEQACTALSKGLADNPGVKEIEGELVYTQKLLQEFERLEGWLARGEYAKVKQTLSKMGLNIKHAVLMEGTADLGLGNADAVVASLKAKILSTDKTNAVALELTAQAHFQNGSLDDAIECAKNAKRYQGKSSNLQLYEGIQSALQDGRSGLNEKQFEKAIQAYSSAIEGTASLPPKANMRRVLFTERAQACLWANKLEDSLSDTKQVLSIDRGCMIAWVTRVQAFQALRDFSSIAKELAPVVSKLGNKFLQDAYQASLNPPDHVDLYELFGVDRAASVQEIKKQYRLKARESHPDRFMEHTEDERKEAEEKFKLLGEGLALLSDSFQRSLYDAGHDVNDIRVQADMMQRRNENQRQTAAPAGQ